MRDYNKELRNRFNKCDNIDLLIEKLEKSPFYKLEKVEDTSPKKHYIIIQYTIFNGLKYKKSQIEIVYRNRTQQEIQDFIELREQEYLEMGHSGIDKIYFDDILRIYY